MEGIVEQVRDGSTVRVYLLPEFQFVQVFIAGIQVYIKCYEQQPSDEEIFSSSGQIFFRIRVIYPFYFAFLGPIYGKKGSS